MNNYQFSFTGIGELVATFPAGSTIQPGSPVKLSTDGTILPCQADEPFCGFAVNPRHGCVSVQLRGFTRVPCSDASITPGSIPLAADGLGGVKRASSNASSFLVASVEPSGFISLLL